MKSGAKGKHVIALHEAGHAVVAHYLGHAVTAISLTLKAGHVERTRRFVVPKKLRKGFVPPPGCPVEEALICAAGDAVEHRARLTSRKSMSGTDAAALEALGVSPFALFSIIRPAADAMVRRLWPQIRQVAAELEGREWPTTLGENECALVLGAAGTAR